MTTPIAYFVSAPRPGTITAIGQAYRTKKSFVSVHFDPIGKGEIVFLPEGVMLRIIEVSSRLCDGFEVMFGNQSHHVFRVDLLARCGQVVEPARNRAIAA
jgi:hypothetical protein